MAHARAPRGRRARCVQYVFGLYLRKKQWVRSLPPIRTCTSPNPFIAICALPPPPHMKLNLQRSKLPTAGFLSRRVTEGLVSVSLAVLLAGGPTPAALASTPSTTLLAGGGRFLDGEAGLMFDEATKARMMEKAKAAKEKVARAHL